MQFFGERERSDLWFYFDNLFKTSLGQYKIILNVLNLKSILVQKVQVFKQNVLGITFHSLENFDYFACLKLNLSAFGTS